MRSYGVKPSPKDDRDFTLDKALAKTQHFPEEYQIKGSKIYDQGEYQQCVAFSLREIKEIQEKKELKHDVSFSNNFIYAARDPNMEQGDGMIPRDALKILQKKGVCDYVLFPGINNYDDIKDKITPEMLKNAKPRYIKAYVRLHTVEQIKTALIALGPVLYCIPVYEYFENAGSTIDYKSELCVESKLLGYHAMVCLGWTKDDYWIIQNSWGESWGDKGLCKLSFDYPLLEAWSVTDAVDPKSISDDSNYLVVFGEKLKEEIWARISKLIKS